MARKAKAFHVEAHGIRVRLFQVGPMWWADWRQGHSRRRVSLRTEVKATAIERATATGRAIAERSLTGVHPDNLTVGQLFTWYRDALPAKRNKKGTVVSAAWQQAADTRMALFQAAWGADLRVADIDQPAVDRFAAQRETGTLSPLKPKDKEHGRQPGPVRARTIDADLTWLKSACAHAQRAKRNGVPLLRTNPLAGLTWAREKNVRRPRASAVRYATTQAHTDAIDPAGRLRCALALARFTGHRITAILSLRVSDLLRTPEAIEAGLVRVSRSEGDAAHMPHGGILWRLEHDKQGAEHVTTIGKECRAEIDRYLRESGRMGEAVLFPSPETDDVPLSRRLATRWLLDAETAAELPKLQGGVWHPYRRAWATDRKGLPSTDVAAAGGWADTRAMFKSYQQADAVTALRVAEGA